jgi:hypothetical protein
MLKRQQRTTVFNVIVSAGLDPGQCDLTEEGRGFSLTHKPTNSLFA